ncbi:hypothetical protein TSAR_005526 [Trichomalopsis sarcophagae]|uniref:Uncharacterized protein n=1 Tax=Trichomalopsis sarcophagae TaxID=543379 RepID=A0A232ENX8_9HYME|nr:hypothetical protein TSAR_005526 [Trichomalopsis sarcophagae]
MPTGIIRIHFLSIFELFCRGCVYILFSILLSSI